MIALAGIYHNCTNCHKAIKPSEKCIREIVNGDTIYYHNYVCRGHVDMPTYATPYEYGKQVERLLKSQKMTIKELAKKVNRSRDYIGIRLSIARKLHPDIGKKNISISLSRKLIKFPMEQQLEIYNERLSKT